MKPDAVKSLATRAGNLLLVDWIADRLWRMRPVAFSSHRPETILIGPPVGGNVDSGTGGNIGDQAMIEAFLDNVQGPVRMIVRDEIDAVLPVRFRGRVTIERMPFLIYGRGLSNYRDLLKLKCQLATANHLAVVGADVMDGAYSERASRNRSRVARLAQQAGVDSRILGFSWNAEPAKSSLTSLRRAGEAGVRLMLRDPVSYERARAANVRSIVQVADMVFSATRVDRGPAERFLGSASRPYALVNVSGFVGQKLDQSAEYDQVIRVLLARGITVIMLPHVSRRGADDIQACRAVQQRHDHPEVRLVDRILRPEEIRGWCSGASIIITGRMHLSSWPWPVASRRLLCQPREKLPGCWGFFNFQAIA